jgi:hypothetical protein
VTKKVKFGKGGMTDDEILAAAERIRIKNKMLKKSDSDYEGIKKDVEETDKNIDQRPEGRYSTVRGLGPTFAARRLEEDSRKGKFASPGFGDLGQFAMKEGGKVKKLASGGFPDLNNDGKVTRADVLKGRGVPGFKKGDWIQSAIKKPGALRAQLGVKGDKPIPAGKLAKAAKAPGKLGQRARLAQTLKKMK